MGSNCGEGACSGGPDSEQPAPAVTETSAEQASTPPSSLDPPKGAGIYDSQGRPEPFRPPEIIQSGGSRCGSGGHDQREPGFYRGAPLPPPDPIVIDRETAPSNPPVIAYSQAPPAFRGAPATHFISGGGHSVTDQRISMDSHAAATADGAITPSRHRMARAEKPAQLTGERPLRPARPPRVYFGSPSPAKRGGARTSEDFRKGATPSHPKFRDTYNRKPPPAPQNRSASARVGQAIGLGPSVTDVLQPDQYAQCYTPDLPDNFRQLIDEGGYLNVKAFGALGLGNIRQTGIFFNDNNSLGVKLDDGSSTDLWKVTDRIGVQVDAAVYPYNVAQIDKASSRLSFSFGYGVPDGTRVRILGAAALPFQGTIKLYGGDQRFRVLHLDDVPKPTRFFQTSPRAEPSIAIVYRGAISRTRVAAILSDTELLLRDEFTEGDAPNGDPFDVYIDDGVPIQEALTAASAASKLQQGLGIAPVPILVYIPAGTYTIGVPAPSSYQIEGTKYQGDGVFLPLVIDSWTTVCGDGAGQSLLTLADNVDQRRVNPDPNDPKTLIYQQCACVFANRQHPDLATVLKTDPLATDQQIGIVGLDLDLNKAGQSPIPPRGNGQKLFKKSVNNQLPDPASLKAVTYVGGGADDMWQALPPDLQVDGAVGTGRNSFYFYVDPPQAPAIGETCALIAAVTLFDPATQQESTLSNAWQFSGFDPRQPLSMWLFLSAFPTHYPGAQALELRLYYRVTTNASAAAAGAEWEQVPLFRQIATIKDALTLANERPFTLDVDPNGFSDLLSVESDLVPSVPVVEDLWIPPGLGITHRGNGVLMYGIAFAGLSDVTIAAVEIQNAPCDGIGLSSVNPVTGADAPAKAIAIDSVYVHDNGRAGLGILNGGDDIKVMNSCFLHNVQSSVDIEPNGANNFSLTKVRFWSCVFGYGSLGVQVFSPAAGANYKGIKGVAFAGCFFYRNGTHLNIKSYQGVGALMDDIDVCRCQFAESIAAAIVIDSEATNSKIRNSIFTGNWRRDFVKALSGFPKPLNTKVVLDPILDGPYYAAGAVGGKASEILVNVDPSGWTISDCLIALSPRFSGIEVEMTTQTVPSILIPAGVLQVKKDFISGILLDRS